MWSPRTIHLWVFKDTKTDLVYLMLQATKLIINHPYMVFFTLKGIIIVVLMYSSLLLLDQAWCHPASLTSAVSSLTSQSGWSQQSQPFPAWSLPHQLPDHCKIPHHSLDHIPVTMYTIPPPPVPKYPINQKTWSVVTCQFSYHISVLEVNTKIYESQNIIESIMSNVVLRYLIAPTG